MTSTEETKQKKNKIKFQAMKLLLSHKSLHKITQAVCSHREEIVLIKTSQHFFFSQHLGQTIPYFKVSSVFFSLMRWNDAEEDIENSIWRDGWLKSWWWSTEEKWSVAILSSSFLRQFLEKYSWDYLILSKDELIPNLIMSRPGNTYSQRTRIHNTRLDKKWCTWVL